MAKLVFIFEWKRAIKNNKHSTNINKNYSKFLLRKFDVLTDRRFRKDLTFQGRLMNLPETEIQHKVNEHKFM